MPSCVSVPQPSLLCYVFTPHCPAMLIPPNCSADSYVYYLIAQLCVYYLCFQMCVRIPPHCSAVCTSSLLSCVFIPSFPSYVKPPNCSAVSPLISHLCAYPSLLSCVYLLIAQLYVPLIFQLCVPPHCSAMCLPLQFSAVCTHSRYIPSWLSCVHTRNPLLFGCVYP